VLFAGLTTLGALFAACRLPVKNPVVLNPHLTDNRFALVIPISDTGSEEENFLSEIGAQNVRRV
jgi:hypothetical protein